MIDSLIAICFASPSLLSNWLSRLSLPLPFQAGLGAVLLLVVLGRDERHGLDLGVTELLANLDLDLGALLVLAVLNVTHGDVDAEGRRRDTRRDDTNLLLALGVKDLGTLTSWDTLDLETHTAARGAVGNLIDDARRAGEGTLSAAVLACGA